MRKEMCQGRGAECLRIVNPAPISEGVNGGHSQACWSPVVGAKDTGARGTGLRRGQPEQVGPWQGGVCFGSKGTRAEGYAAARLGGPLITT